MMQLAQLLTDFAGLDVGLLDEVTGGDGEPVLDGLEGGLDAADDLLHGVVDVLHPLGDLAAHVAEVVLDLAAVGEALLELLAPDLGPLEPEHAQADDHVGGVPGGLGDLVGDVFEFGHLGVPSCRDPGEASC